MRSKRFMRVLHAPALVMLIAAANATPASADDTGSDPAMLAATGLLIISGTFAIANADYVARQSGNYVIGTLGMLVGAPVAGIGALALARSLDADQISIRNVLVSAGLITTGLMSAILGGESVSYAISPPEHSGKVTISPAVLADGGRYDPGMIVRATF